MRRPDNQERQTAPKRTSSDSRPRSKTKSKRRGPPTLGRGHRGHRVHVSGRASSRMYRVIPDNQDDIISYVKNLL